MERNIIERALELAPECRSLPELKARLKSEGYTSLDGHFHGKHIKNQIKELLEGGRLSLPVRSSARRDDKDSARPR